MCVALLGRVIASITRRFQRDLKALIAYSRVAHINYSTLVIIFLRRRGDRRGRLLILRHSFVRGILFMVAGSCLHCLNSRLVYLLKSSLLIKEIGAVILVFTVFSTFSVPPSLRLMGEVPSFAVGLRGW